MKLNIAVSVNRISLLESRFTGEAPHGAQQMKFRGRRQGAFLFAVRTVKGYFYIDLFNTTSFIAVMGERLR